jgi:hypothetical protein
MDLGGCEQKSDLGLIGFGCEQKSDLRLIGCGCEQMSDLRLIADIAIWYMKPFLPAV